MFSEDLIEAGGIAPEEGDVIIEGAAGEGVGLAVVAGAELGVKGLAVGTDAIVEEANPIAVGDPLALGLAGGGSALVAGFGGEEAPSAEGAVIEAQEQKQGEGEHWLFITQRLGGRNTGGGAGGIEGGEEGDEEGEAYNPKRIEGIGQKGDVGDGVDLFGELDPAVVIGEVAEAEAEDEAGGGTNGADEEALEHEDEADLAGAGAHGEEDGDVALFFHDHHDEGDEDVEGGDELDEADGDEADNTFHAEGAEELAVLVHPVGGEELVAEQALGRVGERFGGVEVGDADFDGIDDIAGGHDALELGEGEEGEVGIDVVEAGFDRASDAEAVVAGARAEGGEFPEGVDDLDVIAGAEAEGLGHFVAEENPGGILGRF